MVAEGACKGKEGARRGRRWGGPGREREQRMREPREGGPTLTGVVFFLWLGLGIMGP